MVFHAYLLVSVCIISPRIPPCGPGKSRSPATNRTAGALQDLLFPPPLGTSTPEAAPERKAPYSHCCPPRVDR